MPERWLGNVDRAEEIHESFLVLLSEMSTCTAPCAVVKPSILIHNSFINTPWITKEAAYPCANRQHPSVSAAFAYLGAVQLGRSLDPPHWSLGQPLRRPHNSRPSWLKT